MVIHFSDFVLDLDFFFVLDFVFVLRCVFLVEVLKCRSVRA